MLTWKLHHKYDAIFDPHILTICSRDSAGPELELKLRLPPWGLLIPCLISSFHCLVQGLQLLHEQEVSSRTPGIGRQAGMKGVLTAVTSC